MMMTMEMAMEMESFSSRRPFESLASGGASSTLSAKITRTVTRRGVS
jgi:hypothetical protein